MPQEVNRRKVGKGEWEHFDHRVLEWRGHNRPIWSTIMRQSEGCDWAGKRVKRLPIVDEKYKMFSTFQATTWLPILSKTNVAENWIIYAFRWNIVPCTILKVRAIEWWMEDFIVKVKLHFNLASYTVFKHRFIFLSLSWWLSSIIVCMPLL